MIYNCRDSFCFIERGRALSSGGSLPADRAPLMFVGGSSGGLHAARARRSSRQHHSSRPSGVVSRCNRLAACRRTCGRWVPFRAGTTSRRNGTRSSAPTRSRGASGCASTIRRMTSPPAHSIRPAGSEMPQPATLPGSRPDGWTTARLPSRTIPRSRRPRRQSRQDSPP